MQLRDLRAEAARARVNRIPGITRLTAAGPVRDTRRTLTHDPLPRVLKVSFRAL
jgi:hypothetical protein